MEMNLPRRGADSTRRPTNFFASADRVPGGTGFEVNSAGRIRLPIRCGRTVRTTVSTSGSSGIDEDILSLYFDSEFAEANVGVGIELAGDAVEFPRVPGADQSCAVQSPLSQRAAEVWADAI